MAVIECPKHILRLLEYMVHGIRKLQLHDGLDDLGAVPPIVTQEGVTLGYSVRILQQEQKGRVFGVLWKIFKPKLP
jgi:hypothetical protein